MCRLAGSLPLRVKATTEATTTTIMKAMKARPTAIDPENDCGDVDAGEVLPVALWVVEVDWVSLPGVVVVEEGGVMIVVVLVTVRVIVIVVIVIVT